MIENILDNANCKLKDTHKNLHRWKNWEPNTPFAPVYDLPLWIEDLDPWFVEELIETIKKNNLGICHNTWKNYNIFEWECDIIKYLKKIILNVYKNYMHSLNMLPETNLWIRGWAINLTKNDGLRLHSHAFHENTYLSGNFMISNNKTTTDYVIPHLTTNYGFYKVENIPGRMTLFPSWVQHKVDPISDEERYSIGFDLFTEHSIQYANGNIDDPINKSILLVISE
jgi:hypothetical protein